MKVLITGGSSLLGSYLHRSIPTGVDAHFTWWTTLQNWTLHQMNVCDPSQVGYVFSRVKPDAVIHMAAEGSVDRCEREYTVAEQTNVHGTRNIVMAARDVGARVLLTSTNAVYGGERPPYAEDAQRKPVNVYGRLRLRAENFVMKEKDWQVVRLFLLYGWEPPGARGNWASTAFRKLEIGETMRVVGDIWYMPTWAMDAAQAVWKVLLDCPTEQAYNVAGADSVTLYDFILKAAQVWECNESLVERASIRDFETLAPRPRDTSYNLEKAQNFGLLCRGIGEGLDAMYQDWLEGHDGL
jgi:dTDP-4-dehydrorhamnose reductase